MKRAALLATTALNTPLVMMRAVFNEANACILRETPIPAPSSSEILLKIHWTAVNRADTLQRKGLYPVPPGSPESLGLEAVGTVVGVGQGCNATTTPQLGARVMALLGGGGNAEYVAVLPSHTMPVPPGMTLRDAAAIPETWLTAFQLLFLEGALRGGLAGSTVVIHGAGSGVGTAAVQLASRAGARVIAVAGTQAKVDVCLGLGAAGGVVYKAEGGVDTLPTRLKAAVGPGGAALILDPVGASFAPANMEALGMDGTWVLYGSMGGLKLVGGAGDTLLPTILRKRARLVGTTLRNRSEAYKADLVARFTQEALPYFSGGEGRVFKPIIHGEFPLEEVGAAHTLMESNETIGKLVIKVTGEL